MVPQRNSTDMELQKHERKLKVLNNIDQFHAIKCSTTHVHSCSWLNRLASHLTKNCTRPHESVDWSNFTRLPTPWNLRLATICEVVARKIVRHTRKIGMDFSNYREEKKQRLRTFEEECLCKHRLVHEN
jgi:uncharacterized protein (DUF2237 family)